MAGDAGEDLKDHLTRRDAAGAQRVALDLTHKPTPAFLYYQVAERSIPKTS